MPVPSKITDALNPHFLFAESIVCFPDGSLANIDCGWWKILHRAACVEKGTQIPKGVNFCLSS